MSLTDVQAQQDQRNVPLHRVGVSSVRYPIIWQDQKSAQPTTGTFSLGVALPAYQRGAHLSRFISILQKQHESDAGLVLSLKHLSALHEKMLHTLESSEGQVMCDFRIFREQKAPSSSEKSLSSDQIRLSCDGGVGAPMKLSIGVTVTSLCPCSKEISNYGAHNQRSLVEVHLELSSEQELCLESLARDIAAQGSCEIYNLLKRSDEKAVTEKAYENAKFSEDIVRDVCLMLEQEYPKLKVLQIASTHLESIHQHDAFSVYQGVL